MKTIEYKGYFIHPCQSYWTTDECGVSAFPKSQSLFFFKSIRAAKCWITRHLSST